MKEFKRSIGEGWTHGEIAEEVGGSLTITAIDRARGIITMGGALPDEIWMHPDDYDMFVRDFEDVVYFETGLWWSEGAAKPAVPLTWWSIFMAWLAWLVAVQASNGDAMKRREFFRALLPGALDAAKGGEP